MNQTFKEKEIDPDTINFIYLRIDREYIVSGYKFRNDLTTRQKNGIDLFLKNGNLKYLQETEYYQMARKLLRGEKA